MARTGWLKLWRQMTDNPLWKEKPFTRGQAWIDLLIRANFSDTRIPHPGKIVNVTLGPGEAIISLSGLEVDWGWSRNRLLRFLNYLRCESMIETVNETAFTRLKVLNWKKFQGEDDDGGTGGGTGDVPPPADPEKVVTEPPTEPVTEPATEPIRRKQEQQQQKNTPQVDSTSHVAPEKTGRTEGGLVVVVPEETPGGNGRPDAPAPSLERLLNHRSVRLAAPMLEKIGLAPNLVESFAKTHPVVQILHVCAAAEGKDNPGGWVKEALSNGWKVPESNGDGLANLLGALRLELDRKDEQWRRATAGLAGMSLKRDPAHERRPGESDSEWLRRVQEDLRNRKAKG